MTASNRFIGELVDDYIADIIDGIDREDKDEALHHFMAATEELPSLAKALKPSFLRVYRRVTEFGNSVPEIEEITLLEFVARYPLDKIDHLNAVMQVYPEKIRARSMASFLKQQPLLAFFRALQQNNIAIALRLLECQAVYNGVSSLKISPQRPSHSFINRIQNSKRYPITNMSSYNQGHIAVLLAAKSGNAILFHRLMENEHLQSKLSKSAVLAFLSATTGSQGQKRVLEASRLEIVNLLLEIPHVFAYASSCPVDFFELTEAFQRKKIQELQEDEVAIASISDEDAMLCCYFIANGIEHFSEQALSDVRFLLTIPKVKALVHEPIFFPGQVLRYDEITTLLGLAQNMQRSDVVHLLKMQPIQTPEKHKFFSCVTPNTDTASFQSPLSLHSVSASVKTVGSEETMDLSILSSTEMSSTEAPSLS